MDHHCVHVEIQPHPGTTNGIKKKILNLKISEKLVIQVCIIRIKALSKYTQPCMHTHTQIHTPFPRETLHSLHDLHI